MKRTTATDSGAAVAGLCTGLGAICLPAAMAQQGPHSLWNHPGEDTPREIAADAGLHHWRLAAATPVNRVYAAGR
jgi:hypothetical protein